MLIGTAAYGGTISSYTWICMIINFLQRRNPPVLPSLQKIADCRTTLESGLLSPFADDVDAIKRKGWGPKNTETEGELLFHFFRYYGYEFDYSKYVVCVREGRAVSRKEKGWDPRTDFQDKESRVRLCVEEPFTQDRNLGNSADDYAWYGIHQEIRRAFDLLADGLQLEKCCEEFVFPPEGPKPIFERPKPGPKPVLRRAVSQSNRTNQEPATNRSGRKNNRQPSGQRAGNRRASSGAAYSHHRPGVPFSPPPGANPSDYFQLKGGLHEQLFQQYAFLQAQQDALRQQLERQQHANAARGGDLAGSPRPRQYANGLGSPRLGDLPPQSAPLLPPGYLYHYPGVPRYPPPSPMSQARQREGTTTNPSSPSLVAAMPAVRKNGYRASVPDASTSSARSQSQPGRSMHHPLTLQQHAGYDVSSHRTMSQLYAGHPGLQLPLSAQFPGVHTTGFALDSTQPKEYVGYFSSPQLGPQHFVNSNQMPPPAMALRDLPTRQRRVTPDLAPPLLNGRHNSRSPSPLSQPRGLSLQGDLVAEPAQIVQSPTMNGIPHSGPMPNASLQAAPVLVNGSTCGPVIVNGSTRSSVPKPTERTSTNGIAGPGIQLQNETLSLSEDLSRYRPMQINTKFDQARLDRRPSIPTNESISPTQKPIPDLRASLSPNGTHLNSINGHHHELNPITPAMLSPVAELRTPSPTHVKAVDHDSSKRNGLLRTAKVADAKQVMHEHQHLKADTKVDQERKGGASAVAAPQTTAAASRSPISLEIPPYKPKNEPKNEWQPVPDRKNKHKKSKSTASTKAANGQISPVNDFERKGG